MKTALQFQILRQPDLTTCGPTCLHAVYRYYGDEMPLQQVIQQTPRLEDGGTLAVLLGCHALKRGYQAKIYTYNLQVFDPTWFHRDKVDLAERLQAQMEVKKGSKKLRDATLGYLEFLALGGELEMEDLSSSLIRRYLKTSTPILTGLSATYLYREAREYGAHPIADDVRGFPSGHFVVLCGYDKDHRTALVADPLMPNPLATEHLYAVEMDRLKCAILLGIMTYDANLLIIHPRREHKGKRSVHPDRRE